MSVPNISEIALISAAISLIAAPTYSQSMCSDLSVTTQEIRDRYSADFGALEAEGKNMQEDFNAPTETEAAINVNFDVKWTDQEWIFNLPTVNMKEQTWIFHTPSVVVNDQTIIFHTPSVRMVTVKCGQYPEIHGFTVKWSDILCDIPETFMEEQRIVMGIPEFFMEEQRIILHVPEFEMAEQRWVVTVPEFTATEVSAEVSDLKERGEAIQTRSDALSASLRAELTGSISSGFDCYESELTTARSNLQAQIDLAIQQLSTSIQQVRANGGDPTTVGNNLEARLADLVTERDTQLAKFDQALQDLQASERNAINALASPTVTTESDQAPT